eukprot:TRINITY_DN11594_c0_g1::TRINITY_DN11594_c0_g1_i1::g.21960::m.21960 TRINITY_DN11594_c0_g1::TRINITY_DN11594_c0_g1_i1::g.21960  ORF type:complete len:203 (-),score=39.42,sp/O96552/CHMP1_DICDI/56.02/4e-72,Snf7/PF03357.16/2.8e-26,Ist1/PF03398.9/8.8e-06,DUF4413/PF14372.1/0.024,DUF848/PF05852.6/2.7e+02,DUF848/PF05852.6/0.034,DUF848/PF05852.6/1.4e+03,YejG/PF13989.1/2e+03,YejG/PF13989.1/0.37,Cytochrom_B562/PF07361.6/4.6e+02,Cytochrom_B562/PF07361.6/0.21 TRINITY_DN11594_c0_g1_i1:399-1007(-)
MGQGSSMEKVQNQLFELRFTAKQLNRQATKCQSQEKAEKEKLKKALQQGNMDGARIYAENAIRQKHQYLNYLRLASRIDAVASRLDSAVKMQSVNQSMAQLTKGLDVVLKSMDLDKISNVMEKFEKQFEDMDVQTQFVENSIGATTSLSTPEDEVKDLIGQVAEANGLELTDELAVVPPTKVAEPNSTEDLTERFNKLKEGR